MSLSEQEQRALREIEKSLLAEDPKFGASVSSDSSFVGSGGAITLRGIALVVVGLVMLVGGVALAQPMVRTTIHCRLPGYVWFRYLDASRLTYRLPWFFQEGQEIKVRSFWRC